MPERRPGDEIAGRYVIDDEIGRGGMGAVYAAHDVRLGRRVALKTIGDAPAHARARLEAEARAVASIEHPGIVTLFDVVEDGGETVLVMELVAGETLRQVLKRRALSTEEVANVIYEVADALAAAHAKGLVHRDVKPDNLMLRTDGRVALLDFGIAKQTTEIVDPLAPTTTGAGVIVGTPAYLAPEQAHAQPIGPATDQFALAVTAYELLTRSLPWPTTTPMLLVAAIVSGEPRPLAGFSDAVSAVLSRGLAKDPSDRFPDVRELASALGAALGVAQPSRPRSLLPSGPVPAPTPMPTPPPSAPSTLEIGKTLRATEKDSAAPTAPTRGRRPLALVAALLGLGTAATVVALVAGRRGPAPAASASASAAPTTLAIANLPAEGTSNAAALAAFRDAMRALSVGRGNAPVTSRLDAALADDPEFASAALQRAFVSFRVAGALDAPGRRAYAKALERRSKLGPRDAAFLDALGPSFADPPDWAESGKRFLAMLAKRPGDAEAWEALGILRFKQSLLDAAEDAFVHEQAADPNAFTSYFLRGFLRVNRGDPAGARKLFEQCIARVPATIECRRAVVSMDRIAGECQAADRVARDAAALAPDDPMVYAMRAETAAALGAPQVAVTDLLAQKRAHMPAAQRAVAKADDDFALALRDGDFPAALAALDAGDAADESGRVDDFGRRAVARASVLREMGAPRHAADTAIAFLDRMSAHAVPEQPWQDPTGALLAVAEAGGRITSAEWDRRREAWVAGWRARLGEAAWAQDGVSVWLGAWANLDDPSPARARRALAALPRFGSPDLSRLDPSVHDDDAHIGSLLLAAGRVDQALPHLEAATRWCRLQPFVHAFVSLGEARAARGDGRGACDAFAEAERAWGHAEPRSVTLEAARADAKRWGCAKDR